MYEIDTAKAYNKAGVLRYKILMNMILYPSALQNFLYRKIRIQDNDRILDAGCGFGVLSRALLNKIKKDGIVGTELHAFDLSPDMLKAFRPSLQKKHPDNTIQIQKLDVRELSYPSDYFDFILTSAMLEYIPSLENGIRSLQRCLKPNGKMYIFISRKSSINKFLFRLFVFGDPHCYSFREVEETLRGLQFRQIKRHKFPLLFFWFNWWGFVIEATK